jgi:hypothetical protein
LRRYSISRDNLLALDEEMELEASEWLSKEPSLCRVERSPAKLQAGISNRRLALLQNCIDDLGVLDFIHTWLQPGAAKREIKGETV